MSNMFNMTLVLWANWLYTKENRAFLAVDDDPLRWWASRSSSYKNLKTVALRYLSTPATIYCAM